MSKYEVIFRWGSGTGQVDLVRWIIYRNIKDTKELIHNWVRPANNVEEVANKIDEILQLFENGRIAYKPKGYYISNVVRIRFDGKIKALRAEVDKMKK